MPHERVPVDSRRRLALVVVIAVAAASVASATTAAPASAECDMYDPWPLFRSAAPSATLVVTGRVTQVVTRDRAGARFTLRVEHVLRGHAPASLVIEGVETARGCVPSRLDPQPGDRLALAFGGRGKGLQGPVTGVAALAPLRPHTPESYTGPDPQLLTLEHIRQLAALPAADLVFFSADDGVHGRELWLTDGTRRGTRMLDDLVPGAGSSVPRSMAAANELLWFSATDPQHGRELWITDGTPLGTRRVRDIVPGPDGSDPELLTVAGWWWVFFVAGDANHGRELWRSDGTVAGTRLVRNIRADRDGPRGSAIRGLRLVNGDILFAADDGIHGVEPWRWSWGTGRLGTRMVGDLARGARGSDPTEIIQLDYEPLFVADDGTHGRQVWLAAGASWGVRMIGDLGGIAATDAHDLVRGPGRLFFVARDGPFGEQLWSAGLSWVDDALRVRMTRVMGFASQDPRPRELTMLGQRTLFFVITDSLGAGRLWSSDGTPGGTRPVFYRGTEGPRAPMGLVAAHGRLFFRDVDAKTGRSVLWTSDGTSGGTRPVIGAATVDPAIPLTRFGARVFYLAIEDGGRRELWVSNGSGAGTHRVAAIGSGSRRSSPRDLTPLITRRSIF